MRIEERDEQPYRSVSRFGPDATVNLDELLPPVYEWLEVRGVEPTGAPFFRYHALDDGRELEVEAGVPVPRGSAIPASDEDVTAGMLPAGRYVVSVISGGPEKLVLGTAELLGWAKEHHVEVDKTWISRLLGGNELELSVRVTD